MFRDLAVPDRPVKVISRISLHPWIIIPAGERVKIPLQGVYIPWIFRTRKSPDVSRRPCERGVRSGKQEIKKK
jgi:hypothetical protein